MKEVTLENINPGTVIVVCGKLAIVEEVKASRYKNPIAYKNNTEHRGYICGIADVQAILGDVDIAEWQGAVGQKPEPIVNRGSDMFLPEELKGVKIGDTIKMRHGRNGVVDVTFEGYKASRPKYPVSYSYNGKQWKGQLRGIVTEQAQTAVA